MTLVKSLSEVHPDLGVASGPVDVHLNVEGSGHVVPLLKVAVTDWAVFMLTTQLPVPEQAPHQPPKVEPPAGDCVRVTLVPLGKLALQVEPQLMPDGEDVTVPVPLPPFVTLRV